MTSQYDTMASNYNQHSCQAFIKLMMGIHTSFDRIISIRNSNDTFKGNTLASFQREVHLENILNTLPKNDQGNLTIGTVRNFLIKNYTRNNVSGILGWVVKENQSLKAIEIVNPNQDLLDKYIRTGADVRTKDYRDFLVKQSSTKQIQSLASAAQNNFKDKKFANSIFSNIKKFYNDTDRNNYKQANEWMLLNDNDEFDLQKHHIVFQEIAEINRNLWDTTANPHTAQYQLFMRGKEIIVKKSLDNNNNKKIKHYCLPHHIYFPVSSEGLMNLPNLFNASNIMELYDYYHYNDYGDDAIKKINSLKTMFGDEAKSFTQKLYQMCVREEYKDLGMPEAQQYNLPTHNNSSSSTARTRAFKTTPYSESEGLICSLCNKVIKTDSSSSDDPWSNIFGKRQSYDVDHLLNLIFNDLFNLNERDDGLGFTNTCGDCNRQFKSEKIWSPSLNLWVAICESGGLTQEINLWPGRNMHGINEKMPFDGWRVFTLENGNKEDIENRYDKVNDNELLKTQGITWKINNPKKKKLDETNELTDKNYQYIEEIFLNRIMKLIQEQGVIENSLVNQVLNTQNGREDIPIVKKYIESTVKYVVGNEFMNILNTWKTKNYDENELQDIIAQENAQLVATQRRGEISDSLEKEGPVVMRATIINIKINKCIKSVITSTLNHRYKTNFMIHLNKYKKRYNKERNVTEIEYRNVMKKLNNLQKNINEAIIKSGASSSSSSSGSSLIRKSTIQQQKEAKAMAEKINEKQFKELQAMIQNHDYKTMSRKPITSDIPIDIYKKLVKIDKEIKQNNKKVFKDKKVSKEQGKFFFDKAKRLFSNSGVGIQDYCNHITNYSQLKINAFVRPYERRYTSDHSLAKKEYNIIKQKWEENKKVLNDIEKEVLHNKKKKKEEEVQECERRLRYINRVRKYYKTIEKQADSCGKEDMSDFLSSVSSFAANFTAKQTKFCDNDNECEDEEICDLETKKCVVDIEKNRDKNNTYLSKIGSTMLRQAGEDVAKSGNSTTDKRKNITDDGNRRKFPKRDPEDPDFSMGGNKTRKNRRRKNRTRRKKSKNKKKNTKKHRRRKNKTRNRR